MDNDTAAQRAAKAYDKAVATGDLTDILNAELELTLADRRGVTADEIAAHSSRINQRH